MIPRTSATRDVLPLLVAACLLWAVAAAGVPTADSAEAQAPVVPQRADDAGVAARADALHALPGPVDDGTYIVGPGDRFTVIVWGQSVVSESVTVSPEGNLVLVGVATIPVAGRTLRQVKSDVEERLSHVYRDVSITVSLDGLRSMVVNVLGAVRNPGAYVCTVLDPASEVIEMAGGFLNNASRRNISMTRRNGERCRVDLIRYGRAGDLSANPPVLDGDLIFVPAATEFIQVEGAVAQPGRYELVDGETVRSAIQIAGGFIEGAVRDSVEVRVRVAGADSRLLMLNPGVEPGASFSLSDGDAVYVRRLSDLRPTAFVEVEGEVLHPGPYGILEGRDRLSDVIERAGGMTDRASLRDAYVERPLGEDEVDAEYDRLSKMDVGDMSEMEYAYFKSVQRNRRSVVADFEKAISGDPASDVILKTGDVIVVPEAITTVNVIGQVTDPGAVTWEPGKRFGYYVDRAGGYSHNAHRNRVIVIKRATGERTDARRAGALAAGDTVWVPERTDTDWWRVVREAATFVTSVLTAYVIVDQAVN